MVFGVCQLAKIYCEINISPFGLWWLEYFK